MGKIGILLLHASHVGIWVNNRFAGMQVHKVKKSYFVGVFFMLIPS